MRYEMAVFLDGVPAVTEDENDETTIQMCYETLFAYCYEQKRAIDTIVIDGESVDIGSFSKYYNVKLKDIKRLDFLTIDQAGLFAKLVNLGKGFVEVADRLETISSLMNSGKDDEAVMILQTASVMTHYLLMTHRFFDLFELPLQYPVGDSNIVEYKEKINPLLNALIDAYQAKDIVEFSDLAEYELAPVLRELGEGLQNLIN